MPCSVSSSGGAARRTSFSRHGNWGSRHGRRRVFLRTITRPGTLTLQVAHTQQAAEEIFRIVHRFVDWLPQELRDGPLKTSQLNVRQIVFPEIDAQYCVVTAGDRNAGRA